MRKLLKGTYRLKGTKLKTKRSEKKTTEQFEARAMRKLGGSIAFVSMSKLLWNGEDEKRFN